MPRKYRNDCALCSGAATISAPLFGIVEQAHRLPHRLIGGLMRALADAALATVQAALEPAAFAEAFTAGQQMALGEAFVTQARINMTERPAGVSARSALVRSLIAGWWLR